jgi:hypothetical protein
MILQHSVEGNQQSRITQLIDPPEITLGRQALQKGSRMLSYIPRAGPGAGPVLLLHLPIQANSKRNL